VADKPPLPHEEVQRILRQLEPLIAERRIVLDGGQAVSFWMRLLQPRSGQLALAEPLTSKDIDFEGGAQALRRAADLLEGRMKLATMDDNTPNTGLVLFTDADGIEREIDFIDAPLDRRLGDVSTGEEAQPRATNVAIAHVAIDHDLEDLLRLMRRSMQLGRRQQSDVVAAAQERHQVVDEMRSRNERNSGGMTT
jgi:hypothetical protein